MDQETLITLTVDIVSSHVAHNTVSAEQVPRMVQLVHEALATLGQPQPEVLAQKVPIVSARASVKLDYIVCMECGKKQKMLKRHLQAAHGMSPDQYRQEYGLPESYPTTAANYSERRRELAKSIGLGRKKAERPQAKRGRAAKTEPASN